MHFTSLSPAPTLTEASGRHLLFNGRNKLERLLCPAMVRDALAASGQWLQAASRATGDTGRCFRTAFYDADGATAWHFPNSNTTELISAWLDLAEVLGDDGHRQMALAYAGRYVSDPVHGLYRGEHREAHGLAWYWRDDQTYTGGYSMRAPGVFHRLDRVASDPCWHEASTLIGETFLRRQLPSGLVHIVGWCPRNGWGHPDQIGSRYVYTIATFASLFGQTGDARYRAAYERSMDALARMQQPDGSFFHVYHPETLEALDPSIKLHFFSYIFNALMEAWHVFGDERIIAAARRLAEYTAGTFYYRQGIPYSLFPHSPTDHAEADNAVHDCANGFLWLYEVTGEAEWFDIGAKLWLQAWLTQADQPHLPEVHGALLRGVRPDLETAPNVTRDPNHVHLLYAPGRVARCEIWFQTLFIFAGVRLLRLL